MRDFCNNIMNKMFVLRSTVQDSHTREFVLDVLLLSSITIFTIALLCHSITWFINSASFALFTHSLGIPIAIMLIILLLLYLFSRSGYFKISAYVIIVIFLLFTSLVSYQRGVGETAALSIDILVIGMAGVLIGTRFAFVVTGFLILLLFVMGTLQIHNIITIDPIWKIVRWTHQDTVLIAIIFIVTAILAWLSNREAERSLNRAHSSETALRAQRDSLEVLVEERTKQLQETQLEKISQLYSFAEFGRLSSGLFHDLMNPLSAVSVNVEKAKTEGLVEGDLSQVQHYLEKAFVAAQRMERFIGAVRKQIGRQREQKEFSLVEETSQVIDILSYKAYVADVCLVLTAPVDVLLVGDPIRYGQALLNLITNAIDAYEFIPQDYKDRTVMVSIAETSEYVICTVLDHGAGIEEKNRENIFKPFFTTKLLQETKGSGIGLSIVKTIIEKDFNGIVTVESNPVSGTVFTLTLPRIIDVSIK